MTQIDFYVLDTSVAPSQEHFACRLADKAYANGVKVFLRVDDAGAVTRLDDMLWTFRDGSFLPHARAEEAGQQPVPVVVGTGEPPADFDKDMLINLAADVPDSFVDYGRVAELAGPDEANRKRAREHFKIYRERGVQPNTHELARK